MHLRVKPPDNRRRRVVRPIKVLRPNSNTQGDETGEPGNGSQGVASVVGKIPRGLFLPFARHNTFAVPWQKSA